MWPQVDRPHVRLQAGPGGGESGGAGTAGIGGDGGGDGIGDGDGGDGGGDGIGDGDGGVGGGDGDGGLGRQQPAQSQPATLKALHVAESAIVRLTHEYPRH
eukprot:7375812-Prymnesium_polylepis.1